MALQIDAKDLEAEKPATSGPLQLDQADLVEATDMGPEARRAASGAPAGPREYSDEQLGLDPGIAKDTYVNPVVNAVFPGSKLPQPSSAVAAEGAGKVNELVNAQSGLDAAGRAIGATALAAPLMAAGEAGAAAAGAGKGLARLIGGAGAGGVTAAIAEKKASAVPAGAAVGAVLTGGSDLMKFVVGRAMAGPTARGYAQAGADLAGKHALEDVAGTVKRYGVESVKSPQVAKEALEAGIKRATKVSEEAWKVAQSATVKNSGGLVGKGVGKWEPGEADIKFAEKLKMPLDRYREWMGAKTAEQLGKTGDMSKNPLVVEAIKKMNQANQDVAILKKLHAVASKLVAAGEYKPTLIDKVLSGAGKAAKAGAVGAAGAGAYKMFSGE